MFSRHSFASFKPSFLLVLLVFAQILTASRSMAQSSQNSLHFDGVNDRVVIPDNNALDMTNNYTLEAWVYPTQFINGAGILSKWQTTNGRGYMLRLAGTSGGVTIDERNSSDNVLTLNTWNHIAAVNDNGTRKLYINGTQVSLSSSSYSVQANTDPIHIGQDYNDNNRIFKGMIDEVRIWNVVRTQAEIQANYRANLTLPQTGLVAYYGFNQGTPNSSNTGVTTLINGVSSTGSAIDGALQNFTLSGGLSNWVEGKAFLAPSISYASGSVTLTAGTAMTPLTMTNSGGYPDRVQVNTLAGGSGVFRNGAANQATFYGPGGVTADTDGNVWVADQYHDRIRKISTDGIVSTVAGDGRRALISGNGTGASFSMPADIVQDATGNLFVADYGNHCIRKITPAGDVSIFAGNGLPGTTDGNGTSARFYRPAGIAMDASGNLYVADYENHKIRKITPSGTVTTFAGSGSPGFANGDNTLASFYYPQGIAVDGNGNVFVADKANRRIRKITSAGIVSTFAGSGTAGSVNGTGTAASFNSPAGLCIDARGNLYVADNGSHLIRKITPSGVVTTFAGSTEGTSDGVDLLAKFYSPVGIDADPQGNLFVADFQTNRIRAIAGYRIDPALPAGLFFDAKTGAITGTPTTAMAAKAYTVYVKNEIGETTTQITITIASAPTVTTGAASNLTATSATLNATVNANGSATTGLSFTYSQQADLSGGISVSTTPGTATGNTVTAVLANISGLAANTTYYYRVSAANASGASDGSILSFATPPPAPNISYPAAASTVTLSMGVSMSPLTVSNIGGNPDPMLVSTLAGSGIAGSTDGAGLGARFANPQGLAIDNSGNYLYVADMANNKIRRIETATGVVTSLAGSGSRGSADGTGSAASFFQPGYVTLDGSGNLFVSDTRNSKIRKVVVATGEVSTIAGTGTVGFADGAAASAKFNVLYGLVVDQTGSNLYVADGYNYRIRKVDLSTNQVTTLAGSGSYGTSDGVGTSASFSLPWGLVHDLNGNLYVGDFNVGRIRKVVVSTGAVTTIAGSFGGYQDGAGSSAMFNGSSALSMDANGNLYISDSYNSRIRKISIATGSVTTIAGKGGYGFADGAGSEAKFFMPYGIASDNSGNIYVGDYYNHRIRKISKYSISPALPSGLVFNSATGEISGTPSALSPATTYTVTTSNSGGTSTTSFTLEVGASMMTTAASSIGESTATTGGTVGSTYTGITERGVVWHTSTGPTIANNKRAEGGTTTGLFSVNLTGLAPNTTYYVRSYVTYGSAVTEYGNEKTFKTNQLGTFADITKIFGDARFSLTAPTAVSTGAFTYASSNTGVATVSGSEVTIVGAGTTTIMATQAAAGAYASVSKTLTLTVSKATPSITLNIPTTTTLAAANNMSITASASNGEAVTVTIGSGTATGALSGSPGSYLLNGVSASGNLVFNATTAATTNWEAGSKTVTMDVQKNSQAIGFTLSSPVAYSSGLSIPLTATSTTGNSTATGLTVGFSVVSGPATISGSNLEVSSPGVVVVRASQSGNGSYNPAPDVDRTLTVNPGAPTITGFTPTSATEGDVVTITGTNFQNVTDVKFGGTAATSFTVVSSTSITAVLGSGHTGTVTVTTTGGSVTDPGFRYKVIWTGATNAFNQTGNWTGGRVPQTDDDIIFSPTAANDLDLDGHKTVGNVDFNGSGRSLKLGAYNLTVKGHLTMPGNITGSGKVIMTGSAAQTIRGGGDIPELEIASSGGVTIDATGEELTVSGTLRSTSGTLTTNGKLRLKSNSGGTARVDVVSGTISGNVIAERYIQRNENSDGTGRAWRLVSVPVTGTGTLRDFFMNGRSGQDLTLSASRDAETENSGTPIIGHDYATASEATTAGFDWIGVANSVSSLRSYAGDAGGGSFASEHVPSLSTTYAAANQGYMVFARGDRKLEFPSTTSSGATTFRSTGSLKTGPQTVSVAPASTSKYTLVGNPYMSVLNLDALYTTNSSVINPSFWIWDANISGTNKQGGYVNVYKSGTQWVTNTGSYINPELLESGMAFFVEPVSSLSTATNISILESHKSSAASAGLSPFSTEKPDDHGRMYIRLEHADAKGQRQIIDGVMADFHTAHKVALTDISDREKLRNGISRGALWIPREGKTLSGEGLPWPTEVKRSIPLYMSGVGDQTLLVHINPSGMRDRYVAAWLRDNVLKREVEINMSQRFDYDFIGTGRSDWDSTRFEIVYVEAGRPGTGVTLEPDEVAETPSVKLYPNPSKTAEVKLSMRAMAPGAYTVQVLDMTGRLVATCMLEHRSVNGEYRVLSGRLLAPGQYIVRLIDADKQLKETLRMIVE